MIIIEIGFNKWHFPGMIKIYSFFYYTYNDVVLKYQDVWKNDVPKIKELFKMKRIYCKKIQKVYN